MSDLELFPASLLLHPLKIKSPSSIHRGLEKDLKDAQHSVDELQQSLLKAENRLEKATKLMRTFTKLLQIAELQKEKAQKQYETNKNDLQTSSLMISLELLYHPVEAAEEHYQKALVLHDGYKVEMSVIQQEIEELKHCLKIQNLLIDNTKLLSKMLQTKVICQRQLSIISSSVA